MALAFLVGSALVRMFNIQFQGVGVCNTWLKCCGMGGWVAGIIGSKKDLVGIVQEIQVKRRGKKGPISADKFLEGEGKRAVFVVNGNDFYVTKAHGVVWLSMLGTLYGCTKLKF